MPRMIELIRASAVPANLMQAAARGALSLPADEVIEILVYLANHNKVFGEQARLTLAGWEEASAVAAASNPATSPEVLEYMASPENLRPRLLPALLENPAVREESLLELATSGSREVVGAMLNSARVNASPTALNALISNPNLSAAEGDRLKEKLKAAEFEGSASDPATVAEAAAEAFVEGAAEEEPEEGTTADAVLDEELTSYLNEHAGEISAEGEKPFHPIGGLLEELEGEAEETAPEADKPTAAAAGTAASGVAVAKRAPVKKPGARDNRRDNTLQKINKMDIKGRIQMAMKGSKEERSILIRDGTKVVALAVLESPKITDGEVEHFASQKNVLEAVLRAIPMKRRFAKQYSVTRNLVFNPRTPLDVSLGLMKHLLVQDLKNLSGNKEVSETIRKLALKMFKQKTDASKKKE